MTFTYDPTDITTDLALVRTIADDTDSTNVFFTDEQIYAYLELEGDVRGAAALVLETWASNRVKVLQKVELLDIKTDGPAVAAEMRARATTLREQQEDDGDDFDIAEMVVDDFSWREKIFNEHLRSL